MIFNAIIAFDQSVKEVLRTQCGNGALALEANPTDAPSLVLGPLLHQVSMYYACEVTSKKTTGPEMDDTGIKRSPVVRRPLPPQISYGTEART